MTDVPPLEQVLVAVDGHVATVTLNRPEQRNPLSATMLRDLATAFRWCRQEPDVRVIVLTGAGDRAFCTGGDVKEYAETYVAAPRDYWKYMALFRAYIDAILSTATFHWVLDHDALFRHLAAVLRPRGALVAQCGGAGNIASVQRVLASIGDGWLGPVHFETPEATSDRLAAAGFTDIRCWLTEEPTRFERGEPFEPVPPGSNRSAAIILLTDGRRTTGPDPLDAARLAADRGGWPGAGCHPLSHRARPSAARAP